MSGRSTDVSTLSKNPKLSTADPAVTPTVLVRASGFAASTFHVQTIIFTVRNELNEASRFCSSLSVTQDLSET